MATSSSISPNRPPKMLSSIKAQFGSSTLTSIPSSYVFTTQPTNPSSSISNESEQLSIPIIDLSLLTFGTLDQRSKVVQELGKACEEWGFFMVINHGVPENLMKRVIDTCNEFFNQTEEEKGKYEGRPVLDPIRCGTSCNTSVEKVFFWRDFLKVFVHPVFHSPDKPVEFREISLEYCNKVREIVRQLLNGISESLGLEPRLIDKEMNFVEEGLQILAANFYPTCPQPDLAMGLPPHSDHGLLTVLIENGIGGLQVQHNGKWVNSNSLPNSFLVNIGDHMEILSNGKYKSVLHRAYVNNKATRISIAVANGPSLDTIVKPVSKLINHEQNKPAAFIGMKYRDYLEFQQSNQLNRKSCLDRVRT